MTSSVQFCPNLEKNAHSNWTGPTDLRPPGNPLNGPKTVCRSHGTILRNELFFSFRTIYPSICRCQAKNTQIQKSNKNFPAQSDTIFELLGSFYVDWCPQKHSFGNSNSNSNCYPNNRTFFNLLSVTVTCYLLPVTWEITDL